MEGSVSHKVNNEGSPLRKAQESWLHCAAPTPKMAEQAESNLQNGLLLGLGFCSLLVLEQTSRVTQIANSFPKEDVTILAQADTSWGARLALKTGCAGAIRGRKMGGGASPLRCLHSCLQEIHS